MDDIIYSGAWWKVEMGGHVSRSGEDEWVEMLGLRGRGYGGE